MSLLSWQRRLIPSAMSSKWRAPHLNERLEDIYSLSSHSHGIQKIPGKTFKMLKRLVFSPWQRELRNLPDLRTSANLKTARVVLEGATSRI